MGKRNRDFEDYKEVVDRDVIIMKSNIRIICRVLIFFIGFVIIFCSLNYVMRNKLECELIVHFKNEKKDTIDVIFLGSSPVAAGVEPIRIWNDTGITSYNCATSGTNIPMMYYTAKLAIEKQHPQVIIADIGAIGNTDKLTTTARFHAIWDNFTIGKVKYEAISDIVPKENWFEMYFPLYLYHSRWDGLSQSDFEPIDSEDEFKGAKFNPDIVTPFTITAPTEYPTELLPINDTAYEYLERLIDLCDENGVDLVFLALPQPRYAVVEEYLQILNSVEALANERGVLFENGYTDPNFWNIDYYTDFCDTGHANFRGAQKITDHIEEILLNNFDLEDKRGLSEYASWNEEYLRYTAFMDSYCSYNHYSNDTVIDFVSNDQNDFFVNGPWPSNGVCAWSGGKQNDAFFYLDDIEMAGSLLLDFEFADVYAGEVDAQNIAIYFNDNLCGQWSIDKSNVGNVYTCTIPIEYMNIGETNHLVVVYKDVEGDVISKDQDVAQSENPYYAVAYKYIRFRYEE